MKNLIVLFTFNLFLGMISGCGDVPVAVDENTYAPKIVVDAYLYPAKQVRNIRIMRNYALNTEIDVTQVIIADAIVSITDIGTGIAYPLQFNPLTFAYEYVADDLIIQFGRSYRLSVSATIDGETLSTTCTTTVPMAGFSIDRNESALSPLMFRERDENGGLNKFIISFNRSADTESYIASIVALEAADSTFIEKNSFIKKEDLNDNNLLNLLKYQGQWSITEAGGENLSRLEVEWFSIWFYGSYRLILYAADKNFTDYYLTHSFIQDVDGNLWEPKFYFEGDGIGVFGSAIPDTVFFEVLRE